MINSLSEHYFRFRIFILFIQTKIWFLWTMAVAQAVENHENERGLTWYLRRWIYTSISSWKYSQNWLELSLSMPSQETFLKWSRRLFQQNSHSYATKQGITYWVWPKFNRKQYNHMIRISQWSVSHCRTNNSVIRNKKIQKGRIVRVTVRDMSMKVSHLGKVILDNKNL